MSKSLLIPTASRSISLPGSPCAHDSDRVCDSCPPEQVARVIQTLNPTRTGTP